jgi:hypothetical protein
LSNASIALRANTSSKLRKNTKRSAGILEIIHTDICGPFSIASVDGYDSFITFTDDCCHYRYIYPIKK